MKRKLANGKNRIFRLTLLFIAMLAAGTVVEWTDQVGVRFWLKATLAPIAGGVGVVLLAVYFAARLKQRILRMPEGL